ncbi:hypothetical protein DI458_26025 [Burkholderia contaminans]|nr:hypothetical protein [Burkholderia contaminans]MBA9842547.1 hypothetical protein [Burkholderia contaminans]MBA9910079.1 hypothetical protein [Burkholderia contaminans]MBA9934151.1 hypothetical protein [Burkholderia contaminans]MCB4331537.1 hypothetical protein [Burkholderia contaminans]
MFFYLITIDVAYIKEVPKLEVSCLGRVHSRLSDEHEQLSLYSQIGERVPFSEALDLLGRRLQIFVALAGYRFSAPELDMKGQGGIKNRSDG